jgi:uncharacterized membrane protein YhaH (DUF805 family)
VTRLWPALVLAPLFALASISAGYALATPACRGGQTWLLHLPILCFLLLNLITTAMALRALREARREFLPLVATWTGAFFSLVVAAQWLAVLLIPACMS